MSIVTLFKKSAESRFSEQIRPHLQNLYRQAYRLTQDQDDAEDLVQDFLLRLFEKQIDLSEIENPSTWLLRGLYNLFVDNYRKKSRLPVDDRELNSDEIIENIRGSSLTPEKQYIESFTQARLKTAITKLNPDQQALIALHDMEGHKLTELAEIFDTPLGTLKSRLHRARKDLRDLLKNDEKAGNPFHETNVLQNTRAKL